MELSEHAFWPLFSALCDVTDRLQLAGVPEELTDQLDTIIDHCAGLMLQECRKHTKEGRAVSAPCADTVAPKETPCASSSPSSSSPS